MTKNFKLQEEEKMKHEDDERVIDLNNPEDAKKQIAMMTQIIEAELEAGRIRIVENKIIFI